MNRPLAAATGGEDASPTALIPGLADFAHRLRIEDLPPRVRVQTAACVLDTIGCMVAGSMTAEAAALLAAERRAAVGQGGARLPGFAGTLPEEAAARVMGFAGDVFELNDLIGGHASIGTVAAVLALGGARGADGAALLVAAAAGIEISTRIHDAFYARMKPYTDVGMAPVGIPNSFGAAAAAARLIGLGREGLAHAMAISGALAGWCPAEVIFGDGGTVKPMLFGGQPAATAITAARYAAAGLTGPLALLEGERGYFRTAASGFDVAELAPPGPWHLENPRRKQHACCGYIHAVLDMVATLRRTHGAARLRDAAIRIRMPAYIIPAISKQHPPATPNEARFHTQYCVALAAAGVDAIAPAHSADVARHLARPEIQALMQAVEIAVEPAFRHYEECALEVIPRDGSPPLALAGQAAKGSPANPLTPEDVAAKFVALVEGRMPRGAADAYARRVLELESEPDCAWLFEGFTPAA
jgi:2-methylcitrate dehydratase PrpD